jgi:hypothetical protein
MIDVDALGPGPPWAANGAPTARRSIAHLRRAIVNIRRRRRDPNATSHGIDFRAALKGYDKRWAWLFGEYEGRGFHRDGNIPDFVRRVEKYLAEELDPGARANKRLANRRP